MNTDTLKVRIWLKERGIDVSRRGPLPRDAYVAYNRVHPEEPVEIPEYGHR